MTRSNHQGAAWRRRERGLFPRALAALCFCATAAYGKTPSSIAISPQGAVLQRGSSLQFSATCAYPDGTSDNCTAAGGAAWHSSRASAMVVSGSGVATWTKDEGGENAFAIGYVLVSVGKVSDRAAVMGQHGGDVFYQYPTPDYRAYKDPGNDALLPLNVAVGSTVTIGSGFVINHANPGEKSGNPFQMTCNWLSSNPVVATVDRFGQVTAVSPGPVTITCGRAGDGVYGKSTDGRWISPGNVIALTVVAGGQGRSTWYVRPGGGTAFVSRTQTPNGECDGKHDADYPGKGKNQPCAVKNLRDLYADGVTHLHLAWMITGGDTVIVRKNPAGYHVAFDKPYTPTNCEDLNCDLPSVPSGTASQHTRILGENYANCHGDPAKTLLVAYGREAFNVKDSQFVDLSCFEITDRAACGPGQFTNAACPKGSPGGAYGILESALTSSVTYNDLFLHGLVVAGIAGASGVGVVGNYVHIRGMPMAGIDMDDSPWQSGNISVAGGFTLTNSITEFTGCVEEYPVVHNYPYIECRDQNTTGYGDGFGTANTVGTWIFDHDLWRYNFQDGLDLLHSGMQSLTVTNSQSYGNDGQAYKIGAADAVVFRNNTALVNCNRIMSTIGDEPASAVVPGVVPCRAGGDGLVFQFTDQGTYVLQNNSVAGYGAVPYDLACETGWDDCSHANTIFQNNILLGYANPHYNEGQTAAVFYLESPSMPRNGGWNTRDHNVFFNVRQNNCPSPLHAGESCNTLDPKFLREPSTPVRAESALDSFDFHLSPRSKIIGAGVPVSGALEDGLGAPRPNPPSIGALESAPAGSASTEDDSPPPEKREAIFANPRQLWSYCVEVTTSWVHECWAMAARLRRLSRG